MEPKENQAVAQTGAITWRGKAIPFPRSLPCVLCALCGWLTALFRVIGLGLGFRMIQWKANEKATALNERKTHEHLHEVRLHLLRSAHEVQTTPVRLPDSLPGLRPPHRHPLAPGPSDDLPACAGARRVGHLGADTPRRNTHPLSESNGAQCGLGIARPIH